MAKKKYFKVILHRRYRGVDRRGNVTDYSYVDIESNGRVQTCFSRVCHSEEAAKIPAGKYKLEIVRHTDQLDLIAYSNPISLYINLWEGDGTCIWPEEEGWDYKAFNKRKMSWARLHRETYFAMREHYPATLEIIDE